MSTSKSIIILHYAGGEKNRSNGNEELSLSDKQRTPSIIPQRKWGANALALTRTLTIYNNRSKKILALKSVYIWLHLSSVIIHGNLDRLSFCSGQGLCHHLSPRTSQAMPRKEFWISLHDKQSQFEALLDPDLQLEMVKPVTSIKDSYCRLSDHVAVTESLKAAMKYINKSQKSVIASRYLG